MEWNGKWTTTPPSVSGWYWWRLSAEQPGELVYANIETAVVSDQYGKAHDLDTIFEGQWSSEPLPQPQEQ